jgi:hypothetical protein
MRIRWTTRKNGSLSCEEELHNSHYTWMSRLCCALHKDGEKRCFRVMIGARGVWHPQPHARRVLCVLYHGCLFSNYSYTTTPPSPNKIIINPLVIFILFYFFGSSSLVWIWNSAGGKGLRLHTRKTLITTDFLSTYIIHLLKRSCSHLHLQPPTTVSCDSNGYTYKLTLFQTLYIPTKIIISQWRFWEKIWFLSHVYTTLYKFVTHTSRITGYSVKTQKTSHLFRISIRPFSFLRASHSSLHTRIPFPVPFIVSIISSTVNPRELRF